MIFTPHAKGKRENVKENPVYPEKTLTLETLPSQTCYGSLFQVIDDYQTVFKKQKTKINTSRTRQTQTRG